MFKKNVPTACHYLLFFHILLTIKKEKFINSDC